MVTNGAGQSQDEPGQPNSLVPAESAGNVELHLSTAQAPRFPAESPPDFGMPHVDWAHRSHGEYTARVRRLWEVSEQSRGIQAVRADAFHIGHWAKVMHALKFSFGETTEDLDEPSRAHIDQHHSTNLDRLVERGVLLLRGDQTWEPPGAGRSHFGAHPENMRIDVEAYRRLDPDRQIFLDDGVALTLLPARHDPNSVVVSLAPSSHEVEVDSRFIDFFGLCQRYGIPYGWDRSFESLFLGCYDRGARAAEGGAKAVFPQYDPENLQQSALKAPELLTIYATSGVLFNEQVQRQESASTTFKRLSQLLIDGSEHSHFMVRLSEFSRDYLKIRQFMTESQIEIFGMAVTNYIARAILTNNLANLDNLLQIPEELQIPLELPENVAYDLRKYYEEIGLGTVQRVVESINSAGAILNGAINLRKPDEVEYGSEAWPRLPAGADPHAVGNDLPVTDPELKAVFETRFRTYLESRLSPTLLEDDLVDVAREINYYATVIRIMNGEIKGLTAGDSGRPEMPIAVGVTLMLEQATGLKLDQLREQVVRGYERERVESVFTSIDYQSSGHKGLCIDNNVVALLN